MVRKARLVLLGLFLVLGFVSFYALGKHGRIYEWGLAIKWHVLHGSAIDFHGVKIKVPLQWWVTFSNDNQLDLTRVPPRGTVHCGILRFTKNAIDCDSLRKFEAFKIIGQTQVEFCGYDTLLAGTGKLCGILFRSKDDQKKTRNLFQIWTIPTRQIAITATGIPQHCESFYRIFLSRGLSE